jgi:hypothetical protein
MKIISNRMKVTDTGAGGIWKAGLVEGAWFRASRPAGYRTDLSRSRCLTALRGVIGAGLPRDFLAGFGA